MIVILLYIIWYYWYWCRKAYEVFFYCSWSSGNSLTAVWYNNNVMVVQIVTVCHILWAHHVCVCFVGESIQIQIYNFTVSLFQSIKVFKMTIVISRSTIIVPFIAALTGISQQKAIFSPRRQDSLQKAVKSCLSPEWWKHFRSLRLGSEPVQNPWSVSHFLPRWRKNSSYPLLC